MKQQKEKTGAVTATGTAENVKRALRERLQEAADGYREALERQWGIGGGAGWWIGRTATEAPYDWDGMMTLGLEEIVYCVEQGVGYGEVADWQDYVCRTAELGLDVPSLPAWHEHRERFLSADALERIQMQRDELERVIEEEKSKLNE